MDVEHDLRVLRLDPARVLDEHRRVAVRTAAQRVDVEHRAVWHAVGDKQALAGEVKADTVARVRPQGSDLHRHAGHDQVDDAAVREQLRRRLVAGARQQLLWREAERVRKRIRSARGMEHAELCGRPGLVGAAQDADASRRAHVAVEVLVSPDLGSWVQKCTAAVRVVQVGQQDRGHLDLAAERLLEHRAHLGSGLRVVAGIDDDPAGRRFDREAAGDPPAAHRVHAVGDPLDALRIADAPLVIGQQRGAGRDRAVRPDDGFAAQRRAAPRRRRLCGAFLCGWVCRMGKGAHSKRQRGDDTNDLQGLMLHDLVSSVLNKSLGSTCPGECLACTGVIMVP